jgi:hypothetical protein
MTTPIATFETLDEAESALDWIGLDFGEAAGSFEGELAGDDRDLLAAAIDDPETPGPVLDLAQALVAAWDAGRAQTFEFVVAWRTSGADRGA